MKKTNNVFFITNVKKIIENAINNILSILSKNKKGYYLQYKD